MIVQTHLQFNIKTFSPFPIRPQIYEQHTINCQQLTTPNPSLNFSTKHSDIRKMLVCKIVRKNHTCFELIGMQCMAIRQLCCRKLEQIKKSIKN